MHFRHGPESKPPASLASETLPSDRPPPIAAAPDAPLLPPLPRLASGPPAPPAPPPAEPLAPPWPASDAQAHGPKPLPSGLQTLIAGQPLGIWQDTDSPAP